MAEKVPGLDKSATEICTMNTVRLRSWSQYVRLTDRLQGWAFRGELSARWPLVSSLSRRLHANCPEADLWPLREERALRVFRRKAHIHFRDSATLNDDLRCLALMQHHGAPTRLLDFTKSPFIAAFFALEGTEADAAVYALNTPTLWDLAPTFDDALTRDRINPREPSNFARYFLPNRFPIIWFGEPAEMDIRLVAQSGLFVVPGMLGMSIDAILCSYPSESPLLTKYILPRKLRAEAMQALYRMNVTYASLFPDLEGLARASAYELEVIWPRLASGYRAKLGDPSP